MELGMESLGDGWPTGFLKRKRPWGLVHPFTRENTVQKEPVGNRKCSADTLLLGLASSKPMRNKFLLLISYLVYDILLQEQE